MFQMPGFIIKPFFLSLFFRYLLFMKMAALQLMQQKANKDSSKTDMPAISETSEAQADGSVDATQTAAAEGATDNNGPTENSNPTTSQISTESEENSSKPTTNGPVDPAGTRNSECKSPLEGKELEESIPGLAQAKELAETLVSEDGSGIGTSRKKKAEAATKEGELLWWMTA